MVIGAAAPAAAAAKSELDKVCNIASITRTVTTPIVTAIICLRQTTLVQTFMFGGGRLPLKCHVLFRWFTASRTSGIAAPRSLPVAARSPNRCRRSCWAAMFAGCSAWRSTWFHRLRDPFPPGSCWAVIGEKLRIHCGLSSGIAAVRPLPVAARSPTRCRGSCSAWRAAWFHRLSRMPLLLRAAHVAAFASSVAVLHVFLPAPAALPIAYALVKLIAGWSRRCHSAACRCMTALAVVGVAALLLGPSAALPFGVAVWTCPASWLWWRLRKRPATAAALPSRCQKRPAMHPAVATAEERNHEADAQAWQRWKDRHDGRPPSRCATDPEERNIAKAYSYIPRGLFAFRASSTSQKMEQTLRAVQEHMRAHQGALPSRRGGANALRQRFDRIFALAKDEADTLTISVRQLLAECEASAPGAKWTKAERRARKWELGRMQAALREACAAWSAEVGTDVLQLPQLQLAAGPANTFGGDSPISWFREPREHLIPQR